MVLYYCALAILAKFGVETRSQKCTALFLRYVKDRGLIEYDNEFIERITVYREKDEKSEVDEREESRYSSTIKSEKIRERYNEMTILCKKAISQCEEIVFSDKKFNVPKELYGQLRYTESSLLGRNNLNLSFSLFNLLYLSLCD